MSDTSDQLPDLLSLAQLRLVLGPQPQPYRIHAQVDAVMTKQTATGKPYYDIKLTDGGEPLVWRVFDGNPLLPEIAQLARGAWIELNAQWVGNEKYGPEAKQATLRRLSPEESQRLVAGDDGLRERQARDYDEILRLIAGLSDPRLRLLCQTFIERFGERFRRTAAARHYHHARRGGLVEHVAQMMRAAAAIASVYPELNADLMIAGVLFHDCGKLWETCYAESGFNMPYVLSGELLGHITLGMEVINKLWREIIDKPEAAAWQQLEPSNDHVRLHLLHLVASHHGMLEYGSPILPKTPEAIALHHIDNIDAKIETCRHSYQTSTELGAGVFDFVKMLGTRIVTPLPTYRPPAGEAAASEAEDAAS